MNNGKDTGARNEYGCGNRHSLQQCKAADQVLELIHCDRFDIPLQLHLHDFLVSGDHLVSYLKSKFESHVGPLGCQYSSVNIVILACQKLLNCRIRLVLSRLETADRVLQDA
jgi:hypothetical protein